METFLILYFVLGVLTLVGLGAYLVVDVNREFYRPVEVHQWYRPTHAR